MVVTVVGGAAWSLALLFSRRPDRPRREAVDRIQAVVVSSVVVAAASGLPLLAAGARPSDGLHLVYALLAIGIIPLARSMLGRAADPARRIWVAATFIVLAAVLYRLFATG